MQGALEFGCSAWICSDARLDQFLDLLEGVVKEPQRGIPTTA